MARKKQTGFFWTEKIGPVEKCEDGWYRRKNGDHAIVIGKGWKESWYRPEEPESEEEQWAAIEAAIAKKTEGAGLILGIYVVLFVMIVLYFIAKVAGG